MEIGQQQRQLAFPGQAPIHVPAESTPPPQGLSRQLRIRATETEAPTRTRAHRTRIVKTMPSLPAQTVIVPPANADLNSGMQIDTRLAALREARRLRKERTCVAAATVTPNIGGISISDGGGGSGPSDSGSGVIDLTASPESLPRNNNNNNNNNIDDDVVFVSSTRSIVSVPPPQQHFPLLRQQLLLPIQLGNNNNSNNYESDDGEENTASSMLQLLRDRLFGVAHGSGSGGGSASTNQRFHPYNYQQQKPRQQQERAMLPHIIVPAPDPEPADPARLKCTLCQSTPGAKTAMSATVCGHVFCEECLKNSLKA
ncbi:hypothetical protein HK100_010545, partial [Physocladia obscura]